MEVVINVDEHHRGKRKKISEIQDEKDENVQTSIVGESSSNENRKEPMAEELVTNTVWRRRPVLKQHPGGGQFAPSSLKDEDHSSKYKKRKFSLLILVERLGLILIPALLLTLTLPFLWNTDYWEVSIWKWEIMVLFLVSGRFLSRCIIRIIVFWIQRKFQWKVKVLYYVYTLKKTIQNCLWLLLFYLAWFFWFHNRLHSVINSVLLEYLEKTLLCSFLAAALWLFKSLIAKVLTSYFYLRTYFGKIEESVINILLINMLSGPHMVEIRRAKAREEERLATRNFSTITIERSRSEIKDGDGVTLNLLHKLNPKFVLSLEMKSLVKTFTYGALDLEDDHSTLVTTEKDANAATEQIFRNIAMCGSRSIDIEDLMPFMIETQAAQIVNHFKGASDSGKISQTALKEWILNVFRERRTLILRINDTKSPVPKLYNLLNFLAVLVISVSSILTLKMITTKTLTVIGSQFVLVAYIFKNTLTTGFEGIFFVFFMHPYDVGDRCDIDDTELVVKEINLMQTVFISFDQQLVTIPNSELSKKVIFNHNHSPDLEKALQFYIDVSTPDNKVLLLKERIKEYMDGKQDHWYPSPTINMDCQERLDMVKVAVWPTLRMNFVGMRESGIRRSMLIEELMKILRDLDILYFMPLEINVGAFPTTYDLLLVSCWTKTT
ncbi:mechanosensitive ion channel protein 6-like isoform X2 [Vicia villosa]|uniref:mechanosensitive ion channel protein 6-like isoform X1 n=1 Tax=Vicia villosa TaxID=3911 RepID=UPI00273CA6F6|nr:mechanosensitive ion channel protein 6-like isoform X1 [Vicia villosa]XP_058771008.1 mechanosensitive ion channel protein 6-like isoform X2 [Vicia villosa]